MARKRRAQPPQTSRRRYEEPSSSPMRLYIPLLIGVVAIVALLVVGIAALAGSGGSPGSVADVGCESRERLEYHIHAHLNIRVDGANQEVPGDIGVTPGRSICWLHTHGTNGIIHVEAPANRNFTLGQFFDVWGEPLSDASVGPWAVSGANRVWVFVDGQPYTGDPRAIPLANLQSIELQVGPAALEPLPYTFDPSYGSPS